MESALTKKIPFVSDRPTIIFGADVTHPQPGEDSSSSIAAVCILLASIVLVTFIHVIVLLNKLDTIFTGGGIYGLA